jgi:hypothetical protein
LVLRLIEDKIWERYLLGYRSINLDVAYLNPDLLEDLKASYKNVKFDEQNRTLHLEW